MDKYREDVLKFKAYAETGTFFVFDTETTGLSPVDNDIIEFSAVKVSAGSIVDELDLYINNGYPVPEIITELTGITQEKINTDGITPQEAAIKISAFLGADPIVCGYNSISFDQPFVNKLFVQSGLSDFAPKMHLDVLKMAKEKTEKPHKLINMCEKYGISDMFAFHTSIDDAKATYEVYKRLVPLYEEAESTPDASEFVVNRITRWTKSETLDRIYVNNSLNAAVFFDLANDIWVNNTNLDDEVVAKAAYAYAGVNDVTEFKTKY